MTENDMDEDAFITSVPTKFSSFKSKKRSGNDKLNNVRKDHAQLMDIVKKFGSKVSTMVDKQRAEYMLAYENHMQDVQKELYLLREKVQEIATDSTRDEKIKSLELAQTRFKAESITLDEQNNEMRKKLKALTVSMQSTERDRDWLLARLRTAKKRYKRLETVYEVEKYKFDNLEDSEFFNSSVDLSQSQESSLLVGLYKLKDKKDKLSPMPQVPSSSNFKPVTWRGRLAAEVAVNRSDPLVSNTYKGYDANDRNHLFTGGDKDKGLNTAASAPNLHRKDSYAFQNNYQPQKPLHFKSKAEKNDLALLVAMRARREGLRNVIDKCLQSCVKDLEAIPLGSSNTQEQYPLSMSELTVICMEFIEGSYENNVNTTTSNRSSNRRIIEEEDKRRQLASLLATHPQTFLAISDILAGKFSDQNERPSSRAHIEESKELNDIMNFNSSKWLDNMDTDKPVDVPAKSITTLDIAGITGGGDAVKGSTNHEKQSDGRNGLVSNNSLVGEGFEFNDSIADSKVDDAFGNEREQEEEEEEGEDDDDGEEEEEDDDDDDDEEDGEEEDEIIFNA